MLTLKKENWIDLTKEYCESIKTLNLAKTEQLLEKGCPLHIYSYFSEDEQLELGENEFENLSDFAEMEITKAYDDLFLNENKDEMIELLGSYLISNPKEIRFRKNYFIYTNNLANVKKYAEILFNNLGFLKDEKNNWIMGALYNSNDKIFDCLFGYYKQVKVEDKNINVLSGRKLINNKYYNFNSWKKYYEEYFGSFLDYYFNKHESENNYLVSDVFFDLIKYPLELYEDKNTKKIVEPFVDFLVKDYEYFTDINNLDDMMISLCYEKEKKLTKDLENSNRNKRVSPRTGRLSRYFSSLSLQSKLDIVKDMLNKYIAKSIEEKTPQECLSFFKEIGLPKEKYQVLNDYVELNENIKIVDKEIKKISKI